MSPATADVTVTPTADVVPAEPVTRVEILEILDDAFATGPASRGQLVQAARAQGARREVVSLLEQIPDRHYIHQRQLWVHMPQVPVGL
ncbi:DUF2795 domain-containing protein [Actinopolymorpha singaporensis]|uniref:DUF2795 domain-containing protein n=1 Tax=Actinopolymorpha singaporensis TaxID=117157 RepID=A0A1H1QJ46_9ACTN|nr:DUF2795 domain-containing protein [Actinopolymorpha singaporensis]SDS23343.1 Protein of unknown function [Actinopolymorpha singaporensis]